MQVLRHNKNTAGFTLMEILVVLSIVAIFVTIGVVTAQSGRARARDDERKVTLEKLRVALELYRDQHNGAYPNTNSSQLSSEPGDAGYNPAWIPGLTHVYIGELPHDPLGGISPINECIAAKVPRKRSYIYASNGTDYILLAHCSPERTISPDDPYYDLRRPTWAFKVSTPGWADR